MEGLQGGEMTIEKAIEVLGDIFTSKCQQNPRERREAVKLGIEALKVLQDKRTTQSFHPDDLLPGETKE